MAETAKEAQGLQKYLLTLHSYSCHAYGSLKSRGEPVGASASRALLPLGSQDQGVKETIHFTVFLQAVASISRSLARLVFKSLSVFYLSLIYSVFLFSCSSLDRVYVSKYSFLLDCLFSFPYICLQ